MPIRASADIAPTQERRTHGFIERTERPINDVAGRAGRPYRFVDTLAMMERGGRLLPACGKLARTFGIVLPSHNSIR